MEGTLSDIDVTGGTLKLEKGKVLEKILECSILTEIM